MLKIGLGEAAFLGWVAAKHGFNQALLTLLAFLVLDAVCWLYVTLRDTPSSEAYKIQKAKDDADFRRDLLPLSCIVATGVVIWMTPHIIHWVATL